MRKLPKFSPEVQGRAVRLGLDHQNEHRSPWAVIGLIAGKIVSRRRRCDAGYDRQAERHRGKHAGATSSDLDRVKQLERENREQRQANEILRKASA